MKSSFNRKEKGNNNLTHNDINHHLVNIIFISIWVILLLLTIFNSSIQLRNIFIILLVLWTAVIPFFIIRDKKKFKYVLITPATLTLILVSLLPVGLVLILSFSDANLSIFQGGIRWVGLSNFKEILADYTARAAFRRTLLFVIYTVSGQMVFGLVLALLLNREIPGGGLLTSLLLIPIMSPPIILSLLWRNFFAYNVGLFNNILKIFGLGPIPFLTSRTPHIFSWLDKSVVSFFQLNYGFLSVVTMEIWHWTPFVGLILLAGLRSLPNNLYEAAKVDGASPIQSFRFITLPQLRPIIIIALTLRILDAFKVFEPIWALFGNSPLYRSLAVDIFSRAIRRHHFGTASVQAIFLLLSVLILSLLIMRFNRKEMN